MAAFPSWLKARNARSGIAFGDGFVVVARLRPSRHGFKVESSARRDLPEDLVVHSLTKPNIRSVSDLAQFLEPALAEAGCPPGRTAVLLSDRSARGFVLSSSGSAEKQMASRLPFPAGEAAWDVFRSGSRFLVGAAVRRAVRDQYEQVMDAVGYRASVIEPAGLVRLPEWARRARKDQGRDDPRRLSVHVQIHRDHYTFAIFLGAELVDLRVRLRPRGDRRPIFEDLSRLSSFYDGRPYRVVTVAGEESDELAEWLPSLPMERLEANEPDHLTSLLAAVAHRA